MNTRRLTVPFLGSAARIWSHPPTLAMLPWAVESCPEGQWLGPALTAAMEQALRCLPSMTVLNRLDTHWVLSRLQGEQKKPWPSDLKRQVGDRLGADMVIGGEVVIRKGRVQVALSLTQVVDGHTTLLPILEGQEGLLLVPALVAQVVDTLGVPVSRMASQRLVALPTSSQAAFMAYGRALQWDISPHTYPLAQAAYRQALERDPHYAHARKNLGDLLLEAGDLEEAITHYQQALCDQPDLEMARNNLGVAYRRQGRLQEAMEAFTIVIQHNTDQLAVAYAHNNRGNAYRQQRSEVLATEEYQAALRLFPRYAMARANLGVMARRRGEKEEARRYFEEAIALGNELLAVVFAYRQLAKLFADQGEWESMVAVCQEALALRPHDARVYLALGDALRALNRTNEARIAYRAVLGWDNRPALRAEARLRLGQVYQKQHLLAEARREFRAALQLQPENVAAQKGWAETAPER